VRDVAEPLLAVGEVARRLRISVSTVGRLFDDGILQHVQERSCRKAYEGQVDWIVAARNAGRSGSYRDFAAEWLAAQQQVSA
jgi:hypothetical protein